ncbi:MAG: hypothetical protein QM733_23260 [Ilumatobacteraceae bacterium]
MVATPRSASASRTNPRLGRPALEPNTRWTIAAAIAAMSTPARLPSGDVALTIAAASAAMPVTHWPSRRIGSARCGDAVSTTLAGRAMRIAGKRGGAEALRRPCQTSQPLPTAKWWASSPATTATASAAMLSRVIDQRRR